MKKKPLGPASDPQARITALVKDLRKTEEQLQKLTVGEVDAVIHPGGHAYLLHKAQQKLQQSELAQRELAETQMAILNAMPAHVALVDSQGVILSVNESWRRFAAGSGMQGSEFFVGQNYLHICDGATGDCAAEARVTAAGIRRVLQGEAKDYQQEYPCHSPTEKKWFRLTVTLVREDRLLGAVVMHTDITERKLAEAALRESEERFRNMFTAAATGIAVSTPQGRFLEVNEAYCRMLGYTEAELREKDFASLTHPEDLEFNLKMRDEILAGQRDSFVMEKRYFKKNGDIVWTSHSVSATRDAAGAVSSFAVVAEDITERKRAEAEREQQRTELQVLFDLVPAMLCFKDTNNVFLRVNRRLAESAGKTMAEMEGKSAAEIFPRDSAKYFADDLEVIRTGTPKMAIVEKLQGAEGRDLWVQTDKVPVRGRDGKVTGIIVMIQDITERKRIEEHLLWRTALFEAQVHSALDGIIVQDREGTKILQNQRMIDLWNIPPEIAADHEPQRRTEWQTRQIKNSGLVADRLNYLGDHPDEIIRDELELLDGRFIDRYSAPVRGEDGKLYGRIWAYRDITDRKRAEEKLTVFRTLIEGSPDAIEVIDPETGRFLDVNETECRTLGYTREEMLSLTVADVDVEKDYRTLWPAVVEEIRKAGFATIIGRHRRKDGSTFPVEVNARYVDLNRGYLVAVVRDITERKQAEARLFRLIDSNVQGVFFWKTTGAITGANDAFLQIVGYSREDLNAGRVSWKALTPPEFAEADRLALAEIAARGTCTPYEKEFIRQDGSRVPILLGAAIFEDNPDEGVCFTLDLTDRKRTEARIRRLIDSNVQGVVFGNRQGDITEANDAFLRLIGYSREDLQAGRIKWKEITPPEYSHLDLKAIEEIAESGVCKTYEKEYIRKDGSRVPVLIGGASFEDNPEEGVRFVLDLTERKKIEQQFFRAQRMESIGTLAGGIAHDLNNILAPILMSIHLLKDFSEDPQATEILDTIEVSAKRGADIVRQVLTFARGVEGERIEVQPKHLLKDLEHIIKDTFPKDIRLKFHVPNNAWTIFGDPTQIHQILLNLCVNARDAMPNGGNLVVSVENTVLDEQYASMNLQAKAGRYVQISVTDSGMGMSREIINKIFEPFFTTKDITKGTGLGLSTVMAIVKSHEGIVNVYSEPGKGTTFKVYLPAVEGTSPGGKQVTGKVSLVRGKGETILLVDDEASIITITTKTLESFGYRVMSAGDGAEGVALYAGNKDQIAVVLTDMTMPVMDGVAMIHALRRINPAVKVIAASGLNANGSATRVTVPGVKHFLTKPYTAETLLRVLRSILDEPPTAVSH